MEEKILKSNQHIPMPVNTATATATTRTSTTNRHRTTINKAERRAGDRMGRVRRGIRDHLLDRGCMAEGSSMIPIRDSTTGSEESLLSAERCVIAQFCVATSSRHPRQVNGADSLFDPISQIADLFP